jgi:hypothetical protein
MLLLLNFRLGLSGIVCLTSPAKHTDATTPESMLRAHSAHPCFRLSNETCWQPCRSMEPFVAKYPVRTPAPMDGNLATTGSMPTTLARKPKSWGGRSGVRNTISEVVASVCVFAWGVSMR